MYILPLLPWENLIFTLDLLQLQWLIQFTVFHASSTAAGMLSSKESFFVSTGSQPKRANRFATAYWFPPNKDQPSMFQTKHPMQSGIHRHEIKPKEWEEVTYNDLVAQQYHLTWVEFRAARRDLDYASASSTTGLGKITWERYRYLEYLRYP